MHEGGLGRAVLFSQGAAESTLDEFITAVGVLQEARLAQIPHERKTRDIDWKNDEPIGSGV